MTSVPIYVALGDSAGVGFGAAGDSYVSHLHRRLLARDPELRLTNLSMLGARLRDVIDWQLQRIPAGSRIITLAIGTNDVIHRTPEARFQRHLDRLTDELEKFDAAVVLSNIPDLSLIPLAAVVPPAYYAGRLQTFNRLLSAAAARRGFELADLYTFSKDAIPKRKDLFCPDGFHPSAAGQEAWAAGMFPAVDRAANRVLHWRGPEPAHGAAPTKR
jgi:lysophospholipase L1-like esterase